MNIDLDIDYNSASDIMLYVLGLLFGGQVAVALLGRFLRTQQALDKLRATSLRLRGWWAVFAAVAVASLIGDIALTVLFMITSFLALREFVTMAPTSRGDHRALFWSFFAIVPVQYFLVARGEITAFSVFIPVYCFLFLSLRIALAGDYDRFLKRTATVQWGLIACVYCVSHVPALFALTGDFNGEMLLLYLVVVVQVADGFQNLFGTFLGRTPLLFSPNPHATWEGMLGGFVAAIVTGLVLAPATPFTAPESAAIALGLALLGGSGRMVMSAVKRGRGVRYAGVLIEGHGGVLDRVDSLVFAAPVFFHFMATYYQR